MRGNRTNHPPNSGQFKKGQPSHNKGVKTSLGEQDFERFWKFVAVSAVPDACWVWTGARASKGYGAFMCWPKTRVAHRVAYSMTYGPIPAGMCVLHRCDTPPCCRPDHLFLGTRADNNRDMMEKGRMAVGEMYPFAKLTGENVKAMRLLRASGMTFQAIADLYDVHNVTAYFAITGKNWAHIK